MNLPEYREAITGAQHRFQLTVSAAAESLKGDLMKADAMFFEEREPVDTRAEISRELKRVSGTGAGAAAAGRAAGR